MNRAMGKGTHVPIVIVDEHHEILPYVHLAIRKKRLPFDTSFDLIHFDAHPDLSIPRFHPRVYHDPHALYAALDASPSGISEFILPLVYAGHVDRIIWMKPSWCQQMPLGIHRLSIGRGQYRLRLRGGHWPYYLDVDPPQASQEEVLSKIRPFELQVLEEIEKPSKALSGCARVWVLDICLDYFICHNPFADELTRVFPTNFLQVAIFVYTGQRYKDPAFVVTNFHRASGLHLEWLQAMKKYWTRLSHEDNDLSEETMLEDLAPFYPLEMIPELVQFHTQMEHSSEEQRQVVQWAGDQLDLPASPPHALTNQLVQFRQALSRLTEQRTSGPRLITIAQSIGDQYMPRDAAQSVLDQVLSILHEFFPTLDLQVMEASD